MKLGLDIHGVIDTNPNEFSFLSKAVIASGGEVHIITGGSWNNDLKSVVENANISYTHVYSVYDHLMKTGAKRNGKIIFPDGTIQEKFLDDEWDKAKAEYCKKMEISLHIDDTEAYMRYFETPFLLFKSIHRKKFHKSVVYASPC